MHRCYESWVSTNLGRPMEFLWFGWSGYPVVMFPTSQGRFFQYEDMGVVARLAEKVDAGFLQLVCVDSVDAELARMITPSELAGLRAGLEALGCIRDRMTEER